MMQSYIPGAYVKAQFAAKCLEGDCGAIFDLRHLVCPACASDTFMPLATWMDRVTVPA